MRWHLPQLQIAHDNTTNSVAIGSLVYILRILLLSWGLYIMRGTGREQWFGVA